MDDLRKPFFIAAVILMLFVVSIEVGAGLTLRGAPPASGSIMGSISGALPDPIKQALGNVDSNQVENLASASNDVPGNGIPYMAVLDAMLLFTVGLVASSLIITDRVQGRVQGCVTFILSILLILAAIAMIILGIVLLLLVVALLLAVPFGQIG